MPSRPNVPPVTVRVRTWEAVASAGAENTIARCSLPHSCAAGWAVPASIATVALPHDPRAMTATDEPWNVNDTVAGVAVPLDVWSVPRESSESAPVVAHVPV